MSTSSHLHDRDEDAGEGFFAYFVKHRTAANLLLVLCLAAGLFSALNLRAQFFPDIVRETVTVSTAWTGAGATDSDEGVVAVLEPPLLAVPGVEDVRATSREGSSSIVVTFEDGWDMGRATDEVQAAIDSVSRLPSEAEDPVMRRSAFSDRVIDVAITGEVGIDRLIAYSDEFIARLFQEGVPRTSVEGVPNKVIEIAPSEESLLRHDLSLTEVAGAVTRSVTGTPSGEVDASATRIRAGEDVRTIDAVGSTVVRRLEDGSSLSLRDIAQIREQDFDGGVEILRNGMQSIIISVRRDQSGDALAIEDSVKRVVAEMSSTLPDGVEIVTGRSRAEPIRDRRDMLIKNGATGLLLVVGLLFLFLSARTAFWVAAGIPVSIAATLFIMYVSGQTLNMISMFALIISLGIIVDDAIVVGEHADALRRNGHSPASAAGRAARRMWLPVMCASITTVIAFTALTFIGGRFGSLIAAIPFVVSAVIIASLVESFLILPAHMRHSLAAKNRQPWYDAPSRAVNRGFRWFRETLFRPIMQWVVHLRYLVVASIISVFLFSLSIFMDGSVKWEFFSRPDQGTISANVVMQAGADREDTRAMLVEMDRALKVVNERYEDTYGLAPLDFSQATLGDTVGWRSSAGENVPADLKGGFQASLIDSDRRPYSSFKFMADWDSEVKVPANVEVFSLRSERSGPGDDGFDVKFTGADAATLKRAAEALKAGLAANPDVSGLDDTLVYDKTELVLTLTPRGEALGIDTQFLGQELRARLSGIDAAEFARNARQVTVRVAPPDDEIGSDYLERTHIRTPTGAVITLAEVVEVTPRQGFASIIREDGLRIVSITGEIAERTGAQAEVMESLQEELLPAVAAEYGIAYELSGQAEDEKNFLSDAGIGFIGAVIGIYLTLAWAFASWVRPLVVILVIPLGFIGAVWGHFWMGLSLSMFSVVGLIGMTGIIINDSIVLVTTIDEHAERRGMFPSIVDGAVDRLRAVLLTTITTVGGLLPLLFETSRQALFLKPTVVTLAFGLGFGVVLVLLVTPALIAIEFDIRMAMRSFGHARRLGARPRVGLGGRRDRRRGRPRRRAPRPPAPISGISEAPAPSRRDPTVENPVPQPLPTAAE